MKAGFRIAALVLSVSVPCAAQEWSVEAHGNLARTTETHLKSWGAGASLGALWGATNAPIRLGTSLGGDWQKQENSGPTQWSLSYDVTLQPGGESAITPYAGGSISANWLSGTGVPSGAQTGLDYLIGVEIKPDSQSPVSAKLEVRPGYVQTQEHAVTFRAGLSVSM
jgi:hypothetical protein